jgi:hypothetical protein
MSVLQTVTIPKYITKVKISNSRRTIYYNKHSGKGKGKTYTYAAHKMAGKYAPITQDFNGPPYKLPAPKTKILKIYTEGWSWDSRGYLVDADGKRIVANPRTAGEPNYETISGNKITSGYGSPFQIRNITHALKDFYRPFVHKQLVPFKDSELPLRVEWDLYTTIDGQLFDLSNLWFYYKYFEDCLFEEELPDGTKVTPIIPDDNIKYITQSPGPKLIPVDNWNDRKFVIRFYSDERTTISQNDFWQ